VPVQHNHNRPQVLEPVQNNHSQPQVLVRVQNNHNQPLVQEPSNRNPQPPVLRIRNQIRGRCRKAVAQVRSSYLHRK
jgi:hypothetical protein